MKVKSGRYIKENKVLFKKLVSRLLEDFEYVSLLAQDSYSKSFSVSRGGTNIQDNGMFTAVGFVVKIYDQGCYAEYSGNSISEDEIEKIVTLVKEELVNLGSGNPKSAYSVPADEPVSFEKSTEYKVDPEEMGDEKVVSYLKKIFNAGMEMDERVLNVTTNCIYQKYSKLFLSKNKDMEQNVMWATGAINISVSKGEEVKNYYMPFSNLGGFEVLEAMEGSLKECVDVAIELLDSEPMVPGLYDCICDPDTTGMIVHEAFGHGVEMDMFVKDRALAQKYVGDYVASPLITMHDGSTVDQTATYFFDDEGTMAGDTVIIDKGILKAGISDLQSAIYLGTKPTGNGKRESFERKAYTRMTNTYFESGKDKLEDMIKSIKYGFLLENPSSGMEDPKNWGIQCMVNMAREIKDGEFTGKIFSPIVLTGYVPDLLKSISMVSDDFRLGGSGACGKGYKEWVKVSDGGPYIKAKIRLG